MKTIFRIILQTICGVSEDPENNITVFKYQKMFELIEEKLQRNQIEDMQSKILDIFLK